MGNLKKRVKEDKVPPRANELTMTSPPGDASFEESAVVVASMMIDCTCRDFLEGSDRATLAARSWKTRSVARLVTPSN